MPGNILVSDGGRGGGGVASVAQPLQYRSEGLKVYLESLPQVFAKSSENEWKVEA